MLRTWSSFACESGARASSGNAAAGQKTENPAEAGFPDCEARNITLTPGPSPKGEGSRNLPSPLGEGWG